MLSVLHIASDEKFINAANYIFEKAFPGSNRFIIPKSRFHRGFNYVKPGPNIERVYFGKYLRIRLAKKTKKFDCVFLHGISEFNSSVFLLSGDKSKFIGILWGAELYTEENFRRSDLLGNLTRAIKLPESPASYTDPFKRIVRKTLYGNEKVQNDITKNAALNLKYLCVPFDEEYNLFRDKKLISSNCKRILFLYYPLQYLVSGTELICGNDILIGNSASASNNHLEAFEMLRQFETDNRRIIVPLSYGDSKYADYIEEVGVRTFGNNFIPLRTFLHIDDYNQKIKTCGIVIMNHYRQQALGNVLIMIYMGARVFLNESNTIYQFLTRIGVTVYSIERDLNIDNKEALVNLPLHDIEKNRKLLKDVMSEENIIEKLRDGLKNIVS